MTEESLNNCLAYLDKHNLIDHLAMTLLKVLDERPADPVQLIEQYSREVKVSNGSAPSVAAAQIKEKVEINDGRTDKALNVAMQLFKACILPPRCCDAQDAEDEEANDADVDDLVFDSFYMEQCGLSLGDRTSVIRMQCALQNLARMYPLASVRFWGKINGLKSDYYIAQTQLKPGQGDGVPDVWHPQNKEIEYDNGIPTEESGPNKSIKSFTGDLERKVSDFPGYEANYLRAQIARITHAATLCPRGSFVKEDEEDDASGVTPNPEWDGGELHWVHQNPYILNQGRVSWYSKPAPEGDGDDGDAHEQEEQEDGPAVLSAITEDAPLIGGLARWVDREVNNGPKSRVQYTRSAAWPGAYSWCCNKFWGNIYIGDGLKFTGEPYTPPMPRPVQSEFTLPGGKALVEHVDPTLAQERAASGEVIEDEPEEAEDKEDAGEQEQVDGEEEEEEQQDEEEEQQEEEEEEGEEEEEYEEDEEDN